MLKDDYFIKSGSYCCCLVLTAIITAFLNLLGLIIIIYQIFKEPARNFSWGYEGSTMAGGMVTVGMCVFNFSAVGVVLALDKSLKTPCVMTKKYGGVIYIALGIPTIISLIIGDLGFWGFGATDENILRSLPYTDISAMAAITLFMISMGLSYPVQSYPAISMLREVIQYSDYDPTPLQLKAIEHLARPLFLLIAFAIAYYVPFQGPFVAFVGNCSAILMSVLFPVMIDLSLRYNVPGAYSVYNYHLIKDTCLIVITVIWWILGVYFCGYLIYVRILSNNAPEALVL